MKLLRKRVRRVCLSASGAANMQDVPSAERVPSPPRNRPACNV